MNAPYNIHRRSMLAFGAASLFGGQVFAQRAPAGSLTQGRLVVVFLRGAYDGLSALVPYTDQDYYAIRPSIAVAAPDGTRETALKLDDRFALHPALGALMPLWQEGSLGVIASAGLPVPNRSHFDAQYLMEIGLQEKSNAPMGWLNKLAASSTGSALGVGEANPAILSGQTVVKLIPRGDAAARTGVLANAKQRSALMDLYAGNDAVSQAFRQGASSRMQTSQELMNERNMRTANANAEMVGMAQASPSQQRRMLDKDGTPQTTAAQQAQMQAASNGAADPVGLALDAQHLATLMRNDPQLRLGFLSAGGWDTHANQGNATGQLANNLGNLARGLAQLRSEFDRPGDLIIVMSEFGRTAAENGTKGTDHGFGNALWLIGNRVMGGKVHGQWTGLARGNLNENRDLPAHHDYRAVLAQALRSTFKLPDSQLQTLLPGSTWDQRLDGLFRQI
ncbi:DUF1501 domain-containing protein [Variovorax sp. PCZ-1]|uniref:DUF1501 domain-containing protein n=1 Tax=Variovorax sp. PCZ-1 TaxID=2835533 RepID=UPI001BCDBEC1|nr:DUF1501 domain-containing protein [Variovorax sp. PCZ-1]MBS7809204.1 DUF1501 domain-containing protein [Variovorax sp. PCZ-1]